MTLYRENYNKKTPQKGSSSGLSGSFLRQRMLEDMQLHSLSENTQDRYIKGVRKLSRHYKRSPGKISEKEVRYFILNLIKESGLSPIQSGLLSMASNFFIKRPLGGIGKFSISSGYLSRNIYLWCYHMRK